MKAGRDLRRLLKTFYAEYTRTDSVKAHGMHVSVLINRSGIRFGNASAQLAAVERMRKLGWIEVISAPNQASVRWIERIQLTEEGIREAERRWNPSLIWDFWAATVEGIMRFFTRG